VQSHRPQDERADERAGGDAEGAAGDVDGHGGVALALVDHGPGVERAEGVVEAGTKTGERGQDDQGGEGGDEADHREGGGGPEQGETDEAGALAISQESEERLGERGRAAVGQGDVADGLEGEVELVAQERVEHGDDADVHIDREVTEHEGGESAVLEDADRC
jgi:hypothetical protein